MSLCRLRAWGVPFWAALVLAGCAVPVRRPMLGDSPWPRDEQGNYAQGTATVVVSLNYHGVATQACIEQSSGNAYLDQDAIRRAGHSVYTPTHMTGWPISSIARLPINFSLTQKQASTTKPAFSNRPPGCVLKPLLGVPDNEVAAQEVPVFVIAPDADGNLPSGDENPAWPRDGDGHPAQENQRGMVLVGTDGKILEAVVIRAGEFAAFDIATSRKLHGLSFPAGELTHWMFVDIQFRAPGGGAISTKPGRGAWQPKPPVPAGGIRIVREPGKATLANGAPWPRDNDGYYLHAIIVIHAFVEMDGKVAGTKVLRSSGLTVLDRAAVAAVNAKLQAASEQAHWQNIQVEFWPSIDHVQPDAWAPAVHY